MKILKQFDPVFLLHPSRQEGTEERWNENEDEHLIMFVDGTTQKDLKPFLEHVAQHFSKRNHDKFLSLHKTVGKTWDWSQDPRTVYQDGEFCLVYGQNAVSFAVNAVPPTPSVREEKKASGDQSEVVEVAQPQQLEKTSTSEKDLKEADVSVNEVPVSTLNKLVPGLGDFVKKKTMFIVPESKYPHFEWLSSDQMKQNVQRLAPSLTDMMSKDDMDSMLCDITRAQTDIGIIPGASWKDAGLVSPLNNPEYMKVLDYLIKRCRSAIEYGIKTADSRVLGFQLSSSPGGSFHRSMEDYNFKYDVKSKSKILDRCKAMLRGDEPFPAKYMGIVGYRLQLQKPKARPSILLGPTSPSLKAFHAFTKGWESDQRGRHVLGLSWEAASLGMGWNECFNHGVSNDPKNADLKRFWKSTHHQIEDRLLADVAAGKKRFELACDISNNDFYLFQDLLEYIIRALLPERIADEWVKATSEGAIFGGYYDSEGKARYYVLDLAKNKGYARLWSGDPFTSMLNRIVHLANQISVRISTGQLDQFNGDLEAIFNYLATENLTFNNGDDYDDFFESEEAREAYKKAQLSNKSFSIGIEQPGFSGPDHLVAHDGQFAGVETSARSLFRKTLEVERRPVGHPIRSLSYNSLAGKWNNFMEYNHRGDDTNLLLWDVFMEFVGLEHLSTPSELNALATKELQDAEDSEVNRQASIIRLMDILGESQPHALTWKYTYEELEAASASDAANIFIAEKVSDYVDMSYAA